MEVTVRTVNSDNRSHADGTRPASESTIECCATSCGDATSRLMVSVHSSDRPPIHEHI